MLISCAVYLSILTSISPARAWFAAKTGFTTVLDGVYYYSPPEVAGKIVLPESYVAELGQEYGAITVMTTDEDDFGAEALTSAKAKYAAEDDVWCGAFSEVTYLQYTGCGAVANVQSLGKVLVSNVSESIPNGPYFLSSGGDLFKVYRLYSDVQQAFSEAAITSPEGKHSVLPAGIFGENLGVAVPSRLYYTKTDEKPLAGVRLAIKDIYDVAGLRKSNGNRAWYWLYPEANTTAPSMQSLLDAGAVLVGKTKTSQFANGESATADWVDYHSPFNPRGDGYQQTSSSSAGSGAAAGAYGWLDLTVGSDTGGSIRGPSQVQGVYGNRPSHGLATLDGVMPLAPQLDTAGFLTRDPYIWATAAAVMYQSNITFSSVYPSQIVTIGFPTNATKQSDTLLLNFLAAVKNYISANVSALDINAAWSATGPSPAALTDLLNITYPILISKEQIRNVRAPFYAKYAAENDGRRPFVDPVPLYRWSYADNSSIPLSEAVANKTLFMDWFGSNILIPQSSGACSDKVLLYVGSAADAAYRNRYLPPPALPFGFGTDSISIYSEAPDFVLPLGEDSYFSSITNHTEYLPVTVDIMAAKGCDGMMFNLVRDLADMGVLATSAAGRSSVAGGQILYRRGLEGQ